MAHQKKDFFCVFYWWKLINFGFSYFWKLWKLLNCLSSRQFVFFQNRIIFSKLSFSNCLLVKVVCCTLYIIVKLTNKYIDENDVFLFCFNLYVWFLSLFLFYSPSILSKLYCYLYFSLPTSFFVIIFNISFLFPFSFL